MIGRSGVPSAGLPRSSRCPLGFGVVRSLLRTLVVPPT
jgi:hypothetical protein